VVVHSKLPPGLSAAEIDQQVSQFLARGESLYRVDAAALERVQPDLVITQDLCRVCAASPGDLRSVLALLPHSPRIISLDPKRLGDVWENIRFVGEITGRAGEAAALVAELERRVASAQSCVADAPRPRVVCLEWLDPPFVAGHWVPEMVACAGGTDVLGRMAEPGFRVTWDTVLGSEAEVLVLMPCGRGLEQTLEEFSCLSVPKGWEHLRAVCQGRIFAVDASSYFSRPGPRLAAGVEILAYVFHSDRVALALPSRCAANCAGMMRRDEAVGARE